MRKKHTGPDGPRPGKKPGVYGKKVKRLVAVSPDVNEFLAEINASEFIESLIRKSKEFKAWRQGE